MFKGTLHEIMVTFFSITEDAANDQQDYTDFKVYI